MSLSPNLLTGPMTSESKSVEVRITSHDLIINPDLSLSVNVGDGHGRCNLPQSAQDQISHSSDTSIPLFALYLRGAEKADWKKSKDLKEDLDQIIIFVSP